LDIIRIDEMDYITLNPVHGFNDCFRQLSFLIARQQ